MIKSTMQVFLAIAVAYILAAGYCGLEVANTSLPHHVRANYYMFGVVTTAVALIGFACAGACALANYIRSR